MKTKYEKDVFKRSPYWLSIQEIREAESEEEAKKLGFSYAAGGMSSDGREIKLKELFTALLKRFRIMYVPDIRDMIHEEMEIISGDEQLVEKMLKVADEYADDQLRELRPKVK